MPANKNNSARALAGTLFPMRRKSGVPLKGKCSVFKELQTFITRGNINPTLKRVPAHARARVQYLLTVFREFYFSTVGEGSARALRIFIFPTMLSSRNAGAASEVSTHT